MTIPPNFKKGVGRLATDRYDFQAHLDGVNPAGFTDFRHTSDQIDMNPPVIGGATTVQSSLSNVATFIAAQSGIGQGFITVGDGYDTWHAADGSINYDPTIPSLDLLLNPIFNAIISGSPMPSGYVRIKKGGIVVIKAGTYIVVNTINVPPGITLIGEGYGTKIINATSLVLGAIPSPKSIPSPLPLFNVVADGYRFTNDNVIAGNSNPIFMFSRETTIANMVIADNFVEQTQIGDATNFTLPQNNTGNTPLINQVSGSNLTLDNVKFMGRVKFSSGTVVSSATTYAIKLDNSIPSVTGTHLTIKNCQIDGFSQPISFAASTGSTDFLTVINSKIRAHGYLTGDAGSLINNSIIVGGYSNINVSQNHFYGNANNIQSAVYIANITLSIPLLQNRAKIIVSNNNSIVNKLTGADNITYFTLTYDGGISDPTQAYSSLTFGNTFEDAFSLGVTSNDDGDSAVIITPTTVTFSIPTIFNDSVDIHGVTTLWHILNVTGPKTTITNTIELSGAIQVDSLALTGTTTYTIPANGQSVFLCNTTSGTVTLNLPVASSNTNRILIIKDSFGLANTHNIILVPSGSNKIEGINVNKIMSTNWGAVTLYCNGTDWFMI